MTQLRRFDSRRLHHSYWLIFSSKTPDLLTEPATGTARTIRDFRNKLGMSGKLFWHRLGFRSCPVRQAHALSSMAMKRLLPIALLLALVGCGGGSSSSVAPSPVTSPTPAPAAQPASLSGSVTVTGTTVRVIGMTITILDGPNAGRTTTTDAQAQYRFESVAAGNANVSATSSGWEEVRNGTVINGPTTLNFITRTTNPWAANGTGNNVFDKPLWVGRMRVSGGYSGSSSNFIIKCDTSLIVNELLGTLWGQTLYSGTHATDSCKQMRIENSNGVVWSLTEVR